MKLHISIATEKHVFKRALTVALIVGIILTLINQHDVLIEQGILKLNWLKLGLTFMVPYIVSTYSSVMAKLKFVPGDMILSDASLKCSRCNETTVKVDKGDVIPECENCNENTIWKTIAPSGSLKNGNKSDFVLHNPSPVLRINDQGKILDENIASVKLLPKGVNNIKKGLNSFRQLDFQLIISENQKESVIQHIGDKTFQFEIVGINEDNVCQVYGSDITEVEKYKNELQDLAKFPKLNPSPVIRIDNEGIISSANPKANALFEKESIEGLNVIDLFDKINASDITECINKSSIKNYVETIGDNIYKVTMLGVKELESCQIYTSDITEIESSRKKLHSQALFSKLNPEPVIRFDSNGIIIDANPAAHEALTIEEVVGSKIQDSVKKIEEIDIRKCIDENSIFTVDEKINEHIFRFIVRGISELDVCQMYGSEITQRVKAENKVREQKQSIQASINAAKTIQSAVLPKKAVFDKLLNDNFILFQPKDVVSGDFFWVAEKDNKVIFTAADCTGHGVPGGFMSMLGISNLNRILGEDKFETAADILTQLRINIKKALGSDEGGKSKDGMDMALCIWDKGKNKLQYAGAYNPLILIRNQEIIQYKADKMPVGVHFIKDKEFTNHVIDILPEDRCYLYSDGFADQFGGNDGMKFGPKKLRQLLQRISGLPMEDQKRALENEFYAWKKESAQIDDVVVLGVKF